MINDDNMKKSALQPYVFLPYPAVAEPLALADIHRVLEMLAMQSRRHGTSLLTHLLETAALETNDLMEGRRHD